MILGFKILFPWGEETNFKDAYSDGINPNRNNYCNRDEYFKKQYRAVEYCSSCGKSSCGG